MNVGRAAEKGLGSTKRPGAMDWRWGERERKGGVRKEGGREGGEEGA